MEKINCGSLLNSSGSSQRKPEAWTGCVGQGFEGITSSGLCLKPPGCNTCSAGDRTFILREVGRLRKVLNDTESNGSSVPKWKVSAAGVAKQGLLVCAYFKNTKLIYLFWKEGNPPFLPNLWNSLWVNRGWQVELLQEERAESSPWAREPSCLLHHQAAIHSFYLCTGSISDSWGQNLFTQRSVTEHSKRCFLIQKLDKKGKGEKLVLISIHHGNGGRERCGETRAHMLCTPGQ